MRNVLNQDGISSENGSWVSILIANLVLADPLPSLCDKQVTNYNVQTSLATIKKLKKKSNSFGLVDLAAILCTELERTKVQLVC